jgi:hypothetical protein
MVNLIVLRPWDQEGILGNTQSEEPRLVPSSPEVLGMLCYERRREWFRFSYLSFLIFLSPLSFLT